MGQDASTSCPACGVAVAPGYPRCPKCHAALSAPLHLPAPAPARARQAGGTSAASDSPLPWIVGAVAVVVVAGLAIFFFTGGPDERAAASEVGFDAGLAAAVAPVAPVVEDEPGLGTVPAEAPQRRRARLARQLDELLSARRLWAQVRIDPAQADALEIRSAFCEEAGMATAIDELVDDARAAGVTILRCRERHGSLVFERPF